MIKRNSEQWMLLALKEANKALKLGEVPIGAMIVKDNEVLGRGYNQVESLKDSTAHAEIIAITSASNTIDDWRLNECSIYITKEPCLMCIGAILHSRMKRVYFGTFDTNLGFIKKLKVEINIKIPHLKTIQGGILEFECKKIIQDFFLKKR